MTDLDAFRKETRAWLEANCPAPMRTPFASEDEIVWGGRGAKFPSEDAKLWLERMGANMEAVRAEAKIRADQLAKEFRAACEHAEPPAPDEIFDNVYAQPSRRLERQRLEHRAFVSSIEAKA